jgi:hypothetical protein
VCIRPYAELCSEYDRPPLRATGDRLQMMREFTPLLHASIAISTVVAGRIQDSRARECDKLLGKNYQVRQGSAAPGTAFLVASVTEED